MGIGLGKAIPLNLRSFFNVSIDLPIVLMILDVTKCRLLVCEAFSFTIHQRRTLLCLFHSLIHSGPHKIFRRRVRMGWAIPKRWDSRTLTHCAVTKPSRGAGPWTVFPLDVFFQVPGENNPAERGVLYESALGSGGKANVRVSLLFSL
jgi:hypothetical protein